MKTVISARDANGRPAAIEVYDDSGVMLATVRGEWVDGAWLRDRSYDRPVIDAAEMAAHGDGRRVTVVECAEDTGMSIGDYYLRFEVVAHDGELHHYEYRGGQGDREWHAYRAACQARAWGAEGPYCYRDWRGLLVPIGLVEGSGEVGDREPLPIAL